MAEKFYVFQTVLKRPFKGNMVTLSYCMLCNFEEKKTNVLTHGGSLYSSVSKSAKKLDLSLSLKPTNYW